MVHNFLHSLAMPFSWGIFYLKSICYMQKVGFDSPASTSLRSQRSGERRLPRRSWQAKPGCMSTLMKKLPYYVYILKSETDKTRHYTGLTQDLEKRLKAHNNGQVPHTAKHKPSRIETVIMFRSREKAAAFEKYLKSHSGRAFAVKHS